MIVIGDPAVIVIGDPVRDGLIGDGQCREHVLAKAFRFQHTVPGFDGRVFVRFQSARGAATAAPCSRTAGPPGGAARHNRLTGPLRPADTPGSAGNRWRSLDELAPRSGRLFTKSHVGCVPTTGNFFVAPGGPSVPFSGTFPGNCIPRFSHRLQPVTRALPFVLRLILAGPLHACPW